MKAPFRMRAAAFVAGVLAFGFISAPYAHAATGPARPMAAPTPTPLTQPTIAPGQPAAPPAAAAEVGEKHAIVMQEVEQNFREIRKIAGPTNDPEKLLRAALEVEHVSPKAKDIIRGIIPILGSSMGGSPVCADAFAEFVRRNPLSGDFDAWLRSLQAEGKAMHRGCPSWGTGVSYAIAVAKGGRTTIYSPPWLQTHGGGEFMRINWVRTLIADAGGAIAGSIAGPGGALAGGIGTSVVDIASQL